MRPTIPFPRLSLHLLALVALLLAGIPVPGLPQTGSIIAPTSTISHHLLDNGLELLLAPEPGHDVVSVQFWYHVGTRDEGTDSPGFAHLLELLLFSGTDSTRNFDGEIARLGGQTGSATWPDVTLFYDDVPAAAVRRALELEADRMLNLRLRAPVIQATAQSIGFEVTRIVQNAPAQFLNDRLRALAFGEHPYAHPAVRIPGQTGRVDSTRCRQFYERFYRPDNVSVIISGGFESGAVLGIAEEVLAALVPTHPGLPLDRPLPPVPTPAQRSEAFDLGSGLQRIAIGYPVTGASGDERTHASLRLLMRYMNGPGLEAWAGGLRDAAGRIEVVQIEAQLTLDEQAGLLTVQAALADHADAAEVERKLFEGLGGLADAISGATIQLAPLRQLELYRLFVMRQTTSARASALGSAHLLQGDYARYERERDLLDAVTTEDLARAASNLQSARAVVVRADTGT